MIFNHDRAVKPPIVIELSSRLPHDADDVWARIATPKSMNAELMPLVRMTFPDGVTLLELRPDQLGVPLFISWLLAFGLLPFDRHVLTFERFEQRSFFERSHSILQRTWIHVRKVVSDGKHCILSDRVEVVPRVRLFDALTKWLVRRIFKYRHARLRDIFGEDLTPYRREP